MKVAEGTTLVPPLSITGIFHARWAAQAVRTALELGLFEALKGAQRAASDAASAVRCPAHGVELLLDALTGLGLVEKRDEKYGLSEAAELYLIRDSDLFMGAYLNQHDQVMQAWDRLTEAIKEGRPVHEVNKEKTAEEFFPSLAASIFPFSYATARMVAEKLNVSRLPAGARVLDVAAGSGVWTIPMAQANGQLRVDALDFGAVLTETKRFAARYDVAAQYEYLEGNWRDVRLKEEAYDLVVLGYILHSEGKAESEALLAKVRPALKPGGRVIIAEDIPEAGRAAPAFPLLFALNMFLFTTEGCVFTLVELDRMLRAAGYGEIYRLELPYYGKESPVVVATRK